MTRIRPGPSGLDGAERLYRLAAAQRAVISELSIDALLETIVRAGRELLDARYGTLVVFDVDGSAESVVRQGPDADLADRLDASGTAPSDSGLRSILNVAVRGRSSLLAQLYVADPEPDRFDETDAELLASLAPTAGAAIENARRHAELRCSRDWLTASGAITRALLAESVDDVLPDVAARALSVGDADFAALILPTDDERLRVTMAEGAGADDFRGSVFDPAGSELGRSITAARAVRTPDMTKWADPDFETSPGYGPAMIAPLAGPRGSRGALLMMRTAGRPPFSGADLELASMFAGQVGVALELSGARAEAEQLRVLEDRHRIARELHDNVIQRLFAVGVGLQAMVEQPLPADTAHRLRRHIADLDETIDEIRSQIFGLQDDDEQS